MSYFLYLLFRCFIFIFAWTPFFVVYGISNLLYYLLYYVIRYRRAVVRSNLTKAFPTKSEAEIKTIEKQFYRHLADIFLESIKGLSVSDKEIVKRWHITTVELVDNFAEQGQSIIFAGSHYCNWEWGALAVSLQVKPKNIVIYKPIANKYIEQYIKQLRSAFNTEMRSTRETTAAFVENAAIPSAFALLGDQSPSNIKEAHWVSFLGIPTACLHGTAKYAQLYNLPIIFVNIKRIQRGYYEIVGEVLVQNPREYTPEQITTLYMQRLEKMIVTDPSYWLWSHKRWKHQPPTTI